MEAELRASLLRLYLERVRVLGEEDLAAALDELGDEAAQRIRGTAGHDWLPVAFEIAILRSVQRRRGEEGVRELGRDVGRAAMGNAIMRPLVSATFGMLGRHPEALVQLAVAGMSVATRNAGRVRIVSRKNAEVRLLYGPIPEVCRDRALLLRYSGSIEAVLEQGRVRARAELEWNPGEPSALFVVSWQRG